MNKQKKTLDSTQYDPLEIFTVVSSTLGHLGLYLQAWKIFYLQSSHALCFTTYVISMISCAIWLFYGLKRHIRPLIISNIFGLMGIIAVIAGIIIYP